MWTPPQLNLYSIYDLGRFLAKNYFTFYFLLSQQQTEIPNNKCVDRFKTRFGAKTSKVSEIKIRFDDEARKRNRIRIKCDFSCA